MRQTNKPSISFEFFPPASKAGQVRLIETAKTLECLNPNFMSVTYGAGGTTRDSTFDVLKSLARSVRTPLAGHLTCVGHSRSQANDVARDYWNAGIRHIVALRGDFPNDDAWREHSEPAEESYRFANELVAGLGDIAPFEISVAAYPETHPEAISTMADIDNLRRKIEAGGTRAITQYCFDTSRILRFTESCAKAGIEAEIVPGILPISDIDKVRAFSEKCGATVPAWLVSTFKDVKGSMEAERELAVRTTCHQIEILRDAGFQSFHFYTLNRADLTMAICQESGLAPDTVTESEKKAGERKGRNAA